MLSDTTKRRKKYEINIANIEQSKKIINTFLFENDFNDTKGQKSDYFLVSMKNFKPLKQNYAYWAFKAEYLDDKVIIEAWMGGFISEEYPNEEYLKVLNKLEIELLKTKTEKDNFIKKSKSRNYKSNNKMSKNCRIAFTLFMIQAIAYYCGIETNNFRINLTSSDEIAHFIGYNLYAIIGTIMLIKNRKCLNEMIKIRSSIIKIIITIIITILAICSYQDYSENSHNNTKNSNLENDHDFTYDEVKQQCMNGVDSSYYSTIYEQDFKNDIGNKEYIYLLIDNSTGWCRFLEYNNNIQNIINKYENHSSAEREVFEYINGLPLNAESKYILHRISGGYSIDSKKEIMFNYINNLNLSKTEKQGMHNELFN